MAYDNNFPLFTPTNKTMLSLESFFFWFQSSKVQKKNLTYNMLCGKWKSDISYERFIRLCIYGFTSCSRVFHLLVYGDVTITTKGLKNLGIFIVSRLLWQRPWFVGLILSPLVTHNGLWRIYSYRGKLSENILHYSKDK
jgi:hypothetical protein